MGKQRAAWLVVCALVAAGVSLVFRHDAARIVSTRFVQHDDYDRLVIELDRSVSIVRRPETRWDDLIVDVAAAPSESHQEIATGSSRVGMLEIVATPAGARLSSARRERTLRLFQLQDPPRLVVDFADARGAAPSAPADALAVPVQQVARSFSAEAAVELLLQTGTSERPSAVAAGLPLESEERVALAARSAPHGSGLGRRLLYGVPLALLFGALAALASRLTLDAWTRLQGGSRRASHRGGVAAVTVSRGPSIESAERRHDDEASARLELEQRLDRLQQDVERLRAGLSRLTREGEGRA